MIMQMNNYLLMRHKVQTSGLILILVLIMSSIYPMTNLRAQFEDNFDGPELNSSWEGDRNAFIIDEGELRLNATGGGTADLYRWVNYPDSLLVEGYFSLEFPPSGSNKFSLFFMTDDIDTDIASGYFMMVGEGGADDAVEIYRLDDGAQTLIWRGEDGRVATNPQCHYSIKRDGEGNWSVYLAYEKDKIPTLRGRFFDDTYPASSEYYYHVRCDYTASRSDAFVFDNLAVKWVVPDTVPPELVSHKLLDGKTVRLNYNEFLSESVTEPSNFNIETVNIASVNFGEDSTELIVEFDEELPVAEEQTLLINNISDLAGNIADEARISLLYYASRAPEKGEILITEVLPDPKNNGFIPNYEFTEIYNNSDAYLELGGLQYSDGVVEVDMMDYMLHPGAYLIICESESADFFRNHGDVMVLSRFPALKNAGDDVLLLKEGEVLDELSYDDALYGGSSLRQNGYSLERQNIYDPCAEASEIWGPSQGDIKATPGQQNSVWLTSGEVSPIQYQYYRMPEDQVVELVFNKSLLSNNDELEISLEPEIEILQVYADGNVLKIALEDPLEDYQSYRLSIKHLKDCAALTEADFEGIELVGFNTELAAGDMIVNEVLYDSPSRTEQYIELKNCSPGAIDISTLVFSVYKNDVKETFTISEKRILLPEDLLVLSKAPVDISDQYEIRYPEKLIQVDGFISLDRTAGEIRIQKSDATMVKTIDSIRYEKSFHIPFLSSVKGVSLERIACATDGYSRDVWSSAAQTENYGTPTYENSQSRKLSSAPENRLFKLESPTFSPDGDGYEDVLIIRYTGKEVAQRISFDIYNLHGQRVKSLFNNTGVAIQDIITWDGSTVNESVASPGIYLLYGMVYDGKGNKQIWKSSCVVAY